ncbi:hypothetical protein Patl1_36730 [Pistacia atlantica]|nr:hypothetical protein Patl1_36730 [Pistacia atlantica]
MSASSSPRSNSSQATLDASLLNRIQNGPPLTQPVPPPNAGNTTVLDPEYRLWLRQDRLVLLGIQATVNSAVGPTINTCSTSADAWDKLQASYANRSNTRMLTLLTTLMKTTKEGISVSEYMTKIKSVIDDLALIGHPMRSCFRNEEKLRRQTLPLPLNSLKGAVGMRIKVVLLTIEISSQTIGHPRDLPVNNTSIPTQVTPVVSLIKVLATTLEPFLNSLILGGLIFSRDNPKLSVNCVTK